MPSEEQRHRQAIIDACLTMNASGLNQGTAGNVGVRWRDCLLITPSGVPYDELTPDDIVRLGFDGKYDGRLAPSSEWRFHRDILAARPEVGAVVHAHPIYSTALAMRGMDIPAAHYMVAAAGGDSIRCAPYATFGTDALSRHALKALEGRFACLLANHGMIAAGATLKKAMWLAVEVETLARQYVVSLQIGGPNLLSDTEMAEVIERFKSYGPKAKSEATQE
jgi:L-fuculose-phosphate aldolase